LACRLFRRHNYHLGATVGKIRSLQLVEEPLPVAALCNLTWHPPGAQAKESLMRTNGAAKSIQMVARLCTTLPPEAVNH
jgi:hypothetical protein